MDLDFQPDEFSTVFWDVFGEQGHPVRATVSEMGPLLLARMLDLNDVQEGVLNVAFKIADEEGFPLLDFKDLRAILDAISPADKKRKGEDDGGGNGLADVKAAAQKFGNVTKQTIGTIQRQLLVLENQGGENFFGEPALQLKDFMRTDSAGRGMINILAADKLMSSPRLYATFLLWMLSELFEELPEAGDPPKILVREAIALDDAEQKLATRLRVDLLETEASRDRLLALRSAFASHPGDCPVLLHLRIPGESETVIALPDATSVAPSEALIAQVNALVGRPAAGWVH